MVTTAPDTFIAHIRSLGAVWFDIILPETKALASVLTPEERLLGVVYGRYKQEKNGLVSRGLLAATDKRVMLLNKKPLLLERDDINYWAVSGAELNWVGFMGTVTLHTRMGDIHIRTFNKKCAQKFMSVINDKATQR